MTEDMKAEVAELLRQFGQAYVKHTLKKQGAPEQKIRLATGDLYKTGGIVISKNKMRLLRLSTGTRYTKLPATERKFFEEWIDKFITLNSTLL